MRPISRVDVILTYFHSEFSHTETTKSARIILDTPGVLVRAFLTANFCFGARVEGVSRGGSGRSGHSRQNISNGLPSSDMIAACLRMLDNIFPSTVFKDYGQIVP